MNQLTAHSLSTYLLTVIVMDPDLCQKTESTLISLSLYTLHVHKSNYLSPYHGISCVRGCIASGNGKLGEGEGE